MTFCGFPVTIDGDLFVRLGLQQVSYGRWDTPDSQNGFVGLPLVIDLTKMPTKTCTGISMTDCGLTSLKGMPKIKSDAGHDSNIDFSHNRLRSLDGINLSGDAKIKRFTIDNNVIETLAGSPQEVYDTCDVSDNNLRTLIGMPRYIGGDFMCYNNFLKKSTVISRLSDVQGKKCGLNCQRPDPNKAVKMKTKVNEGFTFSDMSDVDYTDTFADMDDKLIIIKE